MKTLKIITGHVIYNLSYAYKFQLKATVEVLQVWIGVLTLYGKVHLKILFQKAL